MDKIIFLDIDGVLALTHKEHDEYGSLFHDEFVNNLKTIIDKTGAKIVISSSWRKSGVVEMKNLWKHRNLPGEIIDTTASLYIQKGGGICFWNDKLNEKPTPKIDGYSIPRGCEIEYWLKDKGFYHCVWDESKQEEICKESGIESYVIIDDDSDMLYNQRNNFVKTSGNMDHEDMLDMGYGLTKKCAELAILILNGGVIKHKIESLDYLKYDAEVFTPPFRLGRKQQRAVLDSKGKEVVIFPPNSAIQANLYVNYLNGETKI